MKSYPDEGREATQDVGDAWGDGADALADWALSRVVARRDCYGYYTPDGKQFTEFAPVSRALLVRHFRGEGTIGAHSTNPDNLCLCVSADIDAHDGVAVDVDANWKCALRLVGLLDGYGLVALICDSNGKGGYHVRAWFKGPVPAAVAHWLGEKVKATLRAEGFADFEWFPKQAGLSLAQPCGNWIRLPGKHHKRDHWTRIWDPGAGAWLEGADAVRRLVAMNGSPPKRLLAAYRAEAPPPDEDPAGGPGKGKGKGRSKDGPRSGGPAADEGELRSALAALNGRLVDGYDSWLGVGMALHDWDSARGLGIWDEWSRGSIRYQPGCCDAKWDSFTAGRGVTVASIFGAAREAGWNPAPHSANGSQVRVESGPEAEAEAEIVDRWPVIDEHAFYGVADQIVRKADPHTEGDPIAVLIQFLVAFGNAVGRGPYWTAGATRHYLTLFCVMVGPTASGRKGSAWDVVEMVMTMVDQDWCDRRVLTGLVSGEGVIHHVRDPVTVRKNGHDEVTDPGVRDKRLLAIEPEFARVLKVSAREGNTLSDTLRQAWDGKKLGSLAKNSGATATSSHISIVAHITIPDIDRYLTATDAGNGYANRYLWAGARRSKILAEGGDIASEDWGAIAKAVADAMVFARGVGHMKRDEEAAAIWGGVYEGLSAARPAMLGAILGRAEAQVMRMACLYALLERSDVVRAPHLLAAIAVWDYCEATVRMVFGEKLGDPTQEKLLAALQAAPEGLTRSEIFSAVFHRHKSSGAIAALLSTLLTCGLIHRRSDNATGGRPAERWYAGRGKRTKS